MAATEEMVSSPKTQDPEIQTGLRLLNTIKETKSPIFLAIDARYTGNSELQFTMSTKRAATLVINSNPDRDWLIEVKDEGLFIYPESPEE